MYRLRMLPLLIAALLPTLAQAQTANDITDSHAQAAHELFESMHMARTLTSTSTAMFDAMQLPQEAKETMLAFVAEIMSWEKLEPQVTEIYTAEFTEDELREIAAFYRTPVGQKLVLTQPILTAKMAQITQGIMMANQGRLMELMQAARAKQ